MLNQTARPRKGSTPVTQATTPWIVQGVTGGTAVAVTASIPGVVSVVGTGVAGTANAGVLTVQGIASMTPLLVTATLASTTITGTVAVTQSTSPWVVSGTLTVGAGTESSTQTALERGGTLERIARLLEAQPDLYELLLQVADAAREGGLRTDIRRWLGSDAPTVGQKAMSASIPVTIASDQPTLPGSVTVTNAVATTRPVPYVDDSCRTRVALDERPATEDTLEAIRLSMLDVDTFKGKLLDPRTWNPSVKSVTASTTAQVMLPVNASRLMASVFNDSTATLYLLFAPGTASSTYYSVKLTAGAYFEFTVPIYPGQVGGVWSAANGSALVTEFS